MPQTRKLGLDGGCKLAHGHTQDGNTKSRDRQKNMDEFNKPDSEYFIFLLSTRAGVSA